MNKLLAFLILFFATTNFAAAQEPVDMAIMQKIKDEAKNNSQIAMIAHNLTDVCGPRLTNSPGYNCSLDWITQICKQWGLQNAGREAWGEFGRGWRNDKGTLALKAPYYQPIIAYPVPWSKSTRKAVTAELVMLDKFDSASIDKLGNNLKGKIVIVKPGSTNLADGFIPYSIRYGDTSLANISEKYMVTRKQMEGYLTFIMQDNATLLYLKKKVQLHYWAPIATPVMEPCLLMAAQAIKKATPLP